MEKQSSFIDNLNEQTDDQRAAIIAQLGIFELRGLGRELGVPSPTTRKRDELVALILQRLNTNSSQAPQRTNKGRPVKKLQNLDQIMSAMTGEDTISFAAATKRIKHYDEVITFAQETPVFSLLDNDELREFEGVFRLTGKIGYFLDMESRVKVFVPAEITKQFDLQTGDYLQVKANKMNNSNQYIVSTVTAVDFSDEKISVNNAKKQIISCKKLPYGDFQLYRGRRNIVEYKHNLYEDGRFADFAKYLNKNKFICVLLGLNSSFEDMIMLSSVENVINFSTRYADDAQVGLDKLVDAISLVNRLGQKGKKVVLFVNDIVEVLNTLDLCFESKELIMEHASETVVIAQKLISLAAAYDDGSEVTLVGTYRDYNKDDKFLINEVLKVSNKFE